MRIYLLSSLGGFDQANIHYYREQKISNLGFGSGYIYRIQDTGYRIPDTGYKIQDT